MTRHDVIVLLGAAALAWPSALHAEQQTLSHRTHEAKALGLNPPSLLLARADEVIE